MILLDICLYGSLSEYKDESFMILLDISVFFLDSLNPVSVSGMIAAVFLAGRAAAGGSLGCSASSGRRRASTPVRRCPAPEVPAGGGELQLRGQSRDS